MRLELAYGMDARSVREEADVREAIEWLWGDPGSPALLEVGLHTFINLYPKIAFGRPTTEMEPTVEPLPEWTAAQDESMGGARTAAAGRPAEAERSAGAAVGEPAGALRTSSMR